MNYALAMTPYLEPLSRLAVLLFMLCTMAGVGLLLEVRQLQDALRERRPLALTLLANFLALPLIAWAVCQWLELRASLQAALLLATTAPGSPIMLRLNAIARGNQALAVSHFIVLSVLTVAFQPLVLPHIFHGIQVHSLDIVRSLGLTVLLPLAVGLWVRACWPVFAERARPVLERTGALAALSIVVLFPTLYFDSIREVVAHGALPALALYLPLAIGVGWSAGSLSRPSYRRVLTLCCGQGSLGVAFVSATTNFHDPAVIVMLIVMLFVSLIPLLPLALYFRGRAPVKMRTARQPG